MKALEKIFSLKNQDIYKIYNILGFKIKVENKYKKLEKALESQTSTLFDLCQDENIRKHVNSDFKPKELLKKITKSPNYVWVDSTHNFLNILLKCDEFKYKENDFNSDEILLCWEIRPTPLNFSVLQKGIRENKQILYIGDSFLRSINTFADDKAKQRYQKGISFTIDDLTSYFDATRMSRLEQMINDKNLVVTDEQKQRARRCIDKIVETHLTKYNHQPIIEPKIGREGVPKVLVVDQSYGDMSIAKGLGSDETFEKMLECAIKENPDADIIVKTHPDTMTGNRGGYYTGLKQHDNIYTQTEPINPISLIKYVDKVYVCSTQFGFEALMCGKEVRVFGMPFYAGWGLTNDEQTCPRRTNKRSLEEIFYLAYIVYSFYVNPETQKECEIEEAMDYLLKLREEYVNSKEM
jgi:capsular polysaccharide export protein